MINVFFQTHKKEADVPDTLHTVTLTMTILLAVTSLICVTMAALVWYKRLKEKKEALMMNVETGITDSISIETSST